jgi:hypothetical protein
MYKMTPHLISAACALALAGSASLAHAEMSSATYNDAKDQLQASYKLDREGCGTLAGNAKDICVETTKGREAVALAHLQMQRTGSPKDTAAVTQAGIAGRYDVAKERCDDLSGNPKDVCVKQAKAERDKDKASAKLKMDVREARTDAEETKAKADYAVASERCNSLSGDTKSACVAAAKTRHGM